MDTKTTVRLLRRIKNRRAIIDLRIKVGVLRDAMKDIDLSKDKVEKKKAANRNRVRRTFRQEEDSKSRGMIEVEKTGGES